VYVTVDERDKGAFARKIVEFGTSPIFSARQLYLCMCSSLLCHVSPAEFQDRFLPTALLLAKDQVAIVRAALARLVARQLLQFDGLAALPDVRGTVDALATDSDREIVAEMSAIRRRTTLAIDASATSTPRQQA